MATATAPPSPKTAEMGRNIKIVSHSPLFYWWPVWAAGFLMAFLTWADGGHMAIVPAGTVAEQARQVEGHDGPRDVLVLPPKGHLPLDRVTNTPTQPRLHMAASKNLG